MEVGGLVRWKADERTSIESSGLKLWEFQLALHKLPNFRLEFRVRGASVVAREMEIQIVIFEIWESDS